MVGMRRSKQAFEQDAKAAVRKPRGRRDIIADGAAEIAALKQKLSESERVPRPARPQAAALVEELVKAVAGESGGQVRMHPETLRQILSLVIPTYDYGAEAISVVEKAGDFRSARALHIGQRGIITLLRDELTKLGISKGACDQVEVTLLSYGILTYNHGSNFPLDDPPSQPADTSQPGMRDDFNTALKQRKAEAVAPLAAALAVARYEVLARDVDLLNPRLAEDERLRRAERLLRAYTRLRKTNPEYRDTGEQLRAARRMHMADFRRRKRATSHAPEAAYR